MLVDDEAAVRATTADMLIELGYEVVEANRGEAAIEQFKRASFDLLVTDYMMGGMTGMALIERIKSEAPDLPVLVISGYADATGIAPEIARLTKPFRSGDLAVMLQEVCGG